MPRPLFILLFSALLAVAAPATPCTAAEPVEAPVKTLLDATGVDVPLFQDARRIVTLAPNVTEMVCYLGFGDRLVGCSDFCDYPPEVVTNLPRVGGFIDTSLEAIVALNPDLVVAYQGNSLELVEQLRSLDIPVVAFKEATGLYGIAGQLHTLATVIGVESFENNPAAVRFTTAIAIYPPDGETYGEPLTVFFGYPGEMSYTCGPGSFLDDLIHRAGCTNVVTGLNERWPMVGAEFIIAADPDVILTATSCTQNQHPEQVRNDMLKELRADPVWSSLEAVQLGRVIVIDSDILMRPGPRLLDALEIVVTQLAVLGFTPTQPAGCSQ